MKKLTYKIALFLSHKLGLWFFQTFSWFIATGYFFLFPARVADSLKFYRALFAGRGFFYHLYCVWKQFHNFTDVYVHRFIPWAGEEAEFIREGWEHLEEAVAGKTGAIVVMSHIGNWELAAQRLNRKGLPIMLYLGAKHKEQVEKLQKDKLAEAGIRVVTTGEKEKSPFALLEGINFLREGGIVSMTGDRLWGEQTSVVVDFLGHEVRLPDTPHLFALMTGAPLMTFFVYQEVEGVYHIKVSRGRRVRAATRADRKKAVLASAQSYADDLACFAKAHPFEWHHFEPFLGEKINK
ncbi:MAG: lauroyl acyltransferase [Deltaproteobacteria bacterium HGW-Deltaproteobacteria-6]|jgi:lauroyl/myristoyl acyltransferase|nr:MAG: lauroyl acyltransferase [Deltaproteobacteria bacterium HGW-Deltaproteobacteria-6]